MTTVALLVFLLFMPVVLVEALFTVAFPVLLFAGLAITLNELFRRYQR